MELKPPLLFRYLSLDDEFVNWIPFSASVNRLQYFKIIGTGLVLK